MPVALKADSASGWCTLIRTDQGSGVEVLANLDPDWFVVDVGGWANTIWRANMVIDIEPYETRKISSNELFGPESWIQMDFGGFEPVHLPFPDKHVDFIWCQQTLEDLASPFGLMRELIRVAKRGFIEIPSREWEITVGVDSPHFAGFCHHHWYGELIPNGDDFIFEMTHKSPYVFEHGSRQGDPITRYLGFTWEDGFDFREKKLLTKEAIIADVQDFRHNRLYNLHGVY